MTTSGASVIVASVGSSFRMNKRVPITEARRLHEKLRRGFASGSMLRGQPRVPLVVGCRP